MARLIWDGEKIVVDASRLNVDTLKRLAEKYNAEHLIAINAYVFNRSIDTILDLLTLENTVIDPSFKPLADKALTVKKNREEAISALELPAVMYNFQKQAVARMLKMERNILLASDPGTGKSLMSIIYMDRRPDSFPAVVVCPASLKVNWQIEFQKWTPERKTYIINGRESYKDPDVVAEAKAADVIIINYDILGVDDKEAQEREKERIQIANENGWKYRKAFIPVKGWVDVINSEIKPKVVCLDECQAIETSTTIRTRGVIQIAGDSRIKKLFLSGTPFETRVAQFYNACHLLAPDLFGYDEYKFKFRYCDPYYNGFGWEFKGISNVDELRYKLSFFMIRHKKEDVLSELPEKQKIPIYFDMDKKFRHKYDSMEAELAQKKDGLSALNYLSEMKKVLVDIKEDLVVQYIKDMLEIEDKLIVFVYHTSMYDYLMTKFKNIAIGINGSVPSLKRQDAVNKFQKDDKVKLFVGQIQAASTGLTLTAAHTVIFAEWGQTPSQHFQAEDRVHRIGQKSERCTIYYLVVKDTIDEMPLSTLNIHASDISAVMDGTETEMVDIDNLILAKVKERKLLKGKKTMEIKYEE